MILYLASCQTEPSVLAARRSSVQLTGLLRLPAHIMLP